MLSIEQCEQILKLEGEEYTWNQVREIRQLLYVLADIEFKAYQQNEYEKGSYIYQGLN